MPGTSGMLPGAAARPGPSARPTETLFETDGPVPIPNRALTRVPLIRGEDGSPHVVASENGGVLFAQDGWYEVLLKVSWSQTSTTGRRFSHTKVPGQQPLHSEAIEADVLALLSDGQQLLRGNSVFGPGWAEELVMEVWQDSGATLDVDDAALTVRDLRVPWR